MTQIAPKTKTLMGILGLVSTILFAVSVYFYYRAYILQTEAANLSNGTQGEPGLPISVMVRILITIVLGFVSLSLIAKGREGVRKATS